MFKSYLMVAMVVARGAGGVDVAAVLVVVMVEVVMVDW